MTQQALDELVDLLDLEPIEVNIFRGRSPDEKRLRVFGGQVAGQALVAAGRTVEPSRAVHSLHAYFLRPGDPGAPILYDVDRIRDGRSFTTRRVRAIQHGEVIFNLAASFQVTEVGPDHQFPMPEVPAPESLPTWQERAAPYKEQMGEWYYRPRPIDFRFIGEADTWWDREPRPPYKRVWFRGDGQLPDDPLLHACVIAYTSDMTLLDTAVLPHGLSGADERLMMASLDHAMWFHRPFRADEWLLYDQESPTAAAARGFGRGTIYASDGRLVVSVVQEGLVRVLDGWPQD